MKILLRIIILLICAVTFLNALVFVGISTYRSLHTYLILIQGHMEENPGAELVESLDGFLLAIVFLIFAIGFGKLFVPELQFLKNIQIPWLEPQNFSELKHVLWEAILTTLVVVFAIQVVRDLDHLTWHHLIIPGAITLIAIALKMLKSSH
jgi:uncharacterized membrane protein YqhA